MDNLQEILDSHAKWLKNEVGGKRANLRGANLRRANLRGANLRGADLQGANLRGANLWRAVLQGADLWRADLRGADLQGANLRGANLQGADLRGADLWRADLWGADLQGADLRGANLWGADLQGADLRGANLEEAIRIPMFCKWPHGITDGQIHVGCEKRSIEEWKKFIESDEVIKTPRDSNEFKQILRVIKAYIAYLE